MKKIAIAMMALVALAMAACGGNAVRLAEAPEAPTTAADTAAPAATPEPTAAVPPDPTEPPPWLAERPLSEMRYPEMLSPAPPAPAWKFSPIDHDFNLYQQSDTARLADEAARAYAPVWEAELEFQCAQLLAALPEDLARAFLKQQAAWEETAGSSFYFQVEREKHARSGAFIPAYIYRDGAMMEMDEIRARALYVWRLRYAWGGFEDGADFLYVSRDDQR